MRTAMRRTMTLKPRRSSRPARVEPVFTLLLDHLLPASEIAVSHGAVHIDHALLEALEQVEVQRAIVQRVAGLHAPPCPEKRKHVGERIHRAVDGLADPVTHRQRREERQDQVRGGPCAPDAKRLAEGLAALLGLPVLCSVEEPADTEGAGDQEPPAFQPRPPAGSGPPATGVAPAPAGSSRVAPTSFGDADEPANGTESARRADRVPHPPRSRARMVGARRAVLPRELPAANGDKTNPPVVAPRVSSENP